MNQPGNARVLKQAVAEIGITGVEVNSESELNAELMSESPASAALVDVTGFGNKVWKFCELLQENEIPFVALSTPGEHALGNRSLSYGATSVLQKPVAKAALLELVRNLPNK